MEALITWKRSSGTGTREHVAGLMPGTRPPLSAEVRRFQCARILLMCAIAKKETEWAGEASVTRSIHDHVDDWYGNALKDSYDAVCSFTGMARARLADLKAHPDTFLRTYKLLVNGRPDSRMYQYGFYMEGGIYLFDCILPGKANVHVDAVNVPATQYTGVRDTPGEITATLSSDFPAAEMMLTTQFTGCTYCFSVHGGVLAAAHIDPGRGTGHTGREISKALRNHGGFSNGNGGEFKAYGMRREEDSFGYPRGALQTIIVGIKQGTTWVVYAQTLLGDTIRVQQIDAL